MLTCIACGTKDQSQMTQRPMAMCAQEQDKGLCISCSQKLDSSQNLVRSMMQMSGLGRKKLSDDDPLFQDPPPKEDCPICMLPMPVNSGVCDVHTNYQSCCGKIICCGCVQASRDETKRRNKERKQKNMSKMKDLCPFCRVADTYSDKEEVKRLKQRVKSNEDDAEAFLRLGNGYNYELWGLKRDRNKAFELYTQAAKLGSVEAHDQISKAYKNGFVPGANKWDMDKAQYHMELAAKGGHEVARHNLGLMAKMMGRMDRVMKHFMIAASSGFDMSLKEVGEGYKAGHVSKEDYTKTLRAYQNVREEMKSEQRTKVAELYSSTYKKFQVV